MSTDAKRAGNARYLSKFKTLTIRVLPEEADQLTAAAGNTGESVQGYIMRAVRGRMNSAEPATVDSTLPNVLQNDAPQPEPVFTPELIRKAEEAAKAAGEPLADFLSRAIDTTAQRDRLGAMLKKKK